MPDTPSTHSIKDDFAAVREGIDPGHPTVFFDAVDRIEEQFDALHEIAVRVSEADNQRLASAGEPGWEAMKEMEDALHALHVFVTFNPATSSESGVLGHSATADHRLAPDSDPANVPASGHSPDTGRGGRRWPPTALPLLLQPPRLRHERRGTMPDTPSTHSELLEAIRDESALLADWADMSGQPSPDIDEVRARLMHAAESLFEQLETLHYAADRLLATGLMGAVGWPSTSSEWRAEIQTCVEALAIAVDAYSQRPMSSFYPTPYSEVNGLFEEGMSPSDTDGAYWRAQGGVPDPEDAP